jgi:hypothetical protein
MSIEGSMRGVVNFVAERADFVDQVTGLAETGVTEIQRAADNLDAARNEAQDLVNRLSTEKFAVASSGTTKEKQRSLLEDIEIVSKDIQRYSGQPEMVRLLKAQRSELYVLLANTYTDAIKDCVPFDAQEIEELRVLLRRSVLDAQSRQKKAYLLDAAIQLSKLGFRAATKLAIV